jgi:hypothetical protein
LPATGSESGVAGAFAVALAALSGVALADGALAIAAAALEALAAVASAVLVELATAALAVFASTTAAGAMAEAAFAGTAKCWFAESGSGAGTFSRQPKQAQSAATEQEILRYFGEWFMAFSGAL